MKLNLDEMTAADVDAAYESYLERFKSLFGDKAEGTFVKFGHTLVQRLGRADFEARLRNYVEVRTRCRSMLESGSTISDAVTLDFEEAAAWLVLKALNLLDMFSGEMG